jgi:hypothetical protein
VLRPTEKGKHSLRGQKGREREREREKEREKEKEIKRERREERVRGDRKSVQ